MRLDDVKPFVLLLRSWMFRAWQRVYEVRHGHVLSGSCNDSGLTLEEALILLSGSRKAAVCLSRRWKYS